MKLTLTRLQKNRHRAASKLAACLLASLAISRSATAQGFIVQLPTQGTFSIQTSVAVPDGGEMGLGGNVRYASGSNQRVGAQAYGSSLSATTASAKVTIIDLQELDKLIRAEANLKPVAVDWNKSRSDSQIYEASLDQPKPDRPAAYAYLMAMNSKPANKRSSIEDARYYLALANDAIRRGHWTAVELYYQMAWDALPETRKQIASESLIRFKEKQNAEEAAKKNAASKGF
jgi:hypothetical protein